MTPLTPKLRQVIRTLVRALRMRPRILRASKRLSRRGLYPFLEAEFASIRPGQSVLSVGSGGQINALLTQFAERIGFHVASIDIDPGRQPDLVGDICTYNFGERQFDCVVLCEVLEHVHSPHVAIANIYALLSDGGRLIITVPFMLPIHEAPRDYYRYTRHGLEFLLKDFDDVVVRARNSYFEAIDVLYVRLVVSENRRARLAAYPLILFALAKAPLSALLGRLIPIDSMTTGYNVRARKLRAHAHASEPS